MRASAWTALALGLATVTVAPPAPAAFLDELPKLYTFKLDVAPSLPQLPLLDPFRDAAVDASAAQSRYASGRWGRWRGQPWWPLNGEPLVEAPRASEPAEPPGSVDTAAILDDDTGDAPLFGFALPPRSLTIAPEAAPDWLYLLAPEPSALLAPTAASPFKAYGFDALWSLPPRKVIPDWRCRRRPVRIARYGGESDLFPLVRCNGAIAREAYDRLTILAREATAPKPGELLPDEPDPDVLERAEWAKGVRLVHPRLLWALQKIADAFPWRTIYVYSGYRYDPSFRTAKPGSHHSMHSEARALDLTVMGIPNQALFQVCRKLTDVGCGFYPNNRFVHVDVRRPGSGHPFWIDVSGPGEPSRYVDAWPGVVDGGALVWDAAGKRGEPAKAGALKSCTPQSRP